MSRTRSSLLSLGVLLAAACERVEEPFPALSDTDTDTGTGSDTDTGPPPTSEGPSDPNAVYDCEPGDPLSCPMGQKCSAVSEGGLQNHFQCVTDDGELPALEPCTPAPENGQDGCAAGTVCLALSEQNLTSGRCLPGCRNDDDCAPGACVVSPISGTTFCAESCDPTLAACPPGLGCRQGQDRFYCGMTMEVDVGVEAEPCDQATLRGCASSYACLPGALIPSCASASCCTRTCDVNGAPDQCEIPTLCKELFTEPAPDFEAVGACFVPA